MSATVDFLAVDLGASGGRVMVGRWDGERFRLEELHRFPNGPINVMGRLHWDHLRLWSEIQTGLARYAAEYAAPPAGIGVDTWGVDYALLDAAGRLLGNPYHYRDPGTEGILEAAFRLVPRKKIYETTGIQFIGFNTLFQLLSRKLAGDPQLELADALLMTPDLFNYWLTGVKASEYTIASTSQMLDARSRRWDTDLLQKMALPTALLQPIVAPGTVLGRLRDDLTVDLGFREPVPIIASGSHDTASAVAAIPELDRQSVYISSGTWSLLGVESAEPVIDETALALDFTNEGGVEGTIRLLKNMTGLWLLQECRRQWQREGRDYSWADLITLAEQADPLVSLIDPDDAAFASPGDMPAAIRDYCRRTEQPEPKTPGAVVRCCLESLALKARLLVRSAELLVRHDLSTVRIVGGGTQNRLLSQFTADACGRPVVAGPVEATALGNVMMQAIATGHLESVAAGRRAIAASVEREVFEPQPSQAWQEAYEQLLALLDAA